MNKDKIKQNIVKILKFFSNPRFLVCYALAWFVTNGWAYLLMSLGTYFDNNIMIAIAGSYLAFLWLPISPEKIVTVAISIFLLKLFFPNDKKTLAVLHDFYLKLKTRINSKKKEEK